MVVGFCAMATSRNPTLRDAATWWTDEAGVVHICESAAPIGTELLVWTLCDREVETGAAFLPTRNDRVSCRKCAAAESILKRREGVQSEAPEPVPVAG